MDPEVWSGCYDGSWKGLITPDAYAHPAKFSRGLIERIVREGLARGWFAPGDLLCDPFGGVGLGGIISAYSGLRWVGCELEEKFVTLAKANFELHADKWRQLGCPVPVILQGDSRKLAEIVGGQVAGVCTSPPFLDTYTQGGATIQGQHHQVAWANRECKDAHRAEYGQTPGQLGRMPAGDVQAVLTSPPFGVDQPCQSQTQGLKDYDGFKCGGRSGAGKYSQDMSSSGNLSTMPAGDFAACVEGVVTSPPYAESLHPNESREVQEARMLAKGQTETVAKMGTASACGMMGYSSDPANLGNLPPGKPVDGCVCSPPFEKSDARKPGPCLAQACAKYGVGTAHAKQDWEPGPGNVGNDSGPTYWQAVADIYRQVWQVLKPGGVMACVVKSYVKNKTLVDLPQQTWDLLLHLGFVPVARIRAMLTKTTESPSIFGGTIVTIKKRASFFRRLAEAKGSPPIDWEEVLCVRKHV